MRFKDLTGQRFGMLTVVERVENTRVGKAKMTRVTWRCKCDCGGESIVTALNLTSGNSNSCGCRKFQGRKPITNEYYPENDYMVGVTTKGDKFIFDKEDLELIKDYCWLKNSEGYFDAKERKTNRAVRLHRIIMGAERGYDVDHINHDPADNRKKNLRIVTRSQNNMNAKLSKNNTTNVPGVVYDKERNKWKAQIGINYKNIILGRFDTKEEAITARKAAEEKYFGEFAYKGGEKG